MQRTNKAIEARPNYGRAFAYLRVSGLSQVNGDGFERQMKAIEEYAKLHRLHIIQAYKEEGISGTLESRPALAEMLVSLEQNGHNVKTVIIEKLDRLARDYMVQEFIIRDFTKQGFNIISTMEGADLCGNDPTRKLIRTIMGGFAEYEKTMIVAKLRAARERIKARTGKCGGRKGYSETSEGQLIIDRIVELRFCGLNVHEKFQKISAVKTGSNRKANTKKMTYQQIADTLNEEGVLTIDGKTWSLQRVQQTLKSHKRKSII